MNLLPPYVPIPREPRRLNGVDLDGLDRTIAQIQSDPASAHLSFRARNRWIDGAPGHTAVGGDLQGRHALERLLDALAECLTTSLSYHAANLGIEVYAIETRIEGDVDLSGFLGLDAVVNPACDRLDVRLLVDAEGGEEVARHLIQIAKQRSPVFDMLTRALRIDVRLEPATN